MVTTMTNILDHFRHWIAYIFNPDIWGGNLSENIIWWAAAAVIASLFYPPLKRWIKAEYEKFHAKLDHNAKALEHIIKHHPSIPEMKEGDE